MSIASPQDRMDALASAKVDQQKGQTRNQQLDQFIDAKIEESRRLIWRAELVRSVLGLIVGLNVFVLIWLILDQWIYSPGSLLRFLCLISLLALVGLYCWRYILPILSSSIEPEYAARAVEKDLPDSRQSLLSYLTLRNRFQDSQLEGSVLRSLAVTSKQRLQHHDAIPNEAAGSVSWWAAAIASFALLVAYSLGSPKSSVQAMMRLAAPLSPIAAPLRVSIEDVVPGDSKVTAGRSVEISARILGLYSNEEVDCLWKSTSSDATFKLTWDPTTDRHQAILPIPHTATGSIEYQISAGDATAGPFQLLIQDIPVVAIDRIDYEPPAYTKIENFSRRVGAIQAVDGTDIVIHANVNRPIKNAKIEFNPTKIGNRIQAKAGVQAMRIDASGTHISLRLKMRSVSESLKIAEKNSYRILVSDIDDQQNLEPIVYPIEIIPDLPPEINITLPSNTPKDLPINAQQLVELHASDPDFGLHKIELEIQYGNNKTLVPVLWESVDGEMGRQVATIPIRPEELSLRIGENVELVGIATDNRSSGDQTDLQPNIVRTDPVQLRISSPTSLPETDDPTADGVSSPDANKTNDPSNRSQNDQDSGGNGSGGSGDTETTSRQNGDSEGQDGSAGSGTQNDTEEMSKESADSGSADSSQSNGEAEGERSSSNQTSGTNGDDTTDASASQPQNDGSDQRTNQNPSELPTGDPNDTPTESPNMGGEDSTPSTSRTPNSNATTSAKETEQDGTPSFDRNDQKPSEMSEDSDNSSQGDPSNNLSQPGRKSNEPDQKGSDSPTESGSEPAETPTNQPQEKPAHDGEAFERIRDYLDQQQQSQNQTGSQTSKDQTSKDQASADNQSSDESSTSENSTDGPTGDEADSRGRAENSEENQAPSDSNSQSNTETPAANGEQSNTAQENSATEQESESGNTTDDRSDQTANPQDSADGAMSNNENANDGQKDGTEGQQTTEKERGEGETENGNSIEQQNQSDAGSTNESSSKETNEQKSETDSQSESEKNSDGEPTQPADSSAQNSGLPQPTLSESDSNQSTATPNQGKEIFGDDSLDNPQPPDEVNLDYAKQATDLVLDYLEQNRDQLNPELLEQLQWSEKELQDFLDRWSRIRELPKTSGESGVQELEETLKSLGLREPTTISTQKAENADSLRSINDGGYSQPVPPAYRDAFNAFRRAMNRSAK